MNDVTVADDGLDHIGKAATIHTLRIDIEQGVRPVTGKRQHDHQSRRQRYKHHPIARGQKARTLHRLGIDKPNETRDGKERKRNRVGNPVGRDAYRSAHAVRERPDHIEENVGSRRVAQHAKQKLLGAREQGATASYGKSDKNNHAQQEYLDLECLYH